LAILK